MNKLCRRDPENKQIDLVCFISAGTLKIFANNFYVLGYVHRSELFLTAWKDALMSAVQLKGDLELDDIYQMVWQPCLEYCMRLLKSLSDLSTRVAEVDRVFVDRKNYLDTQLQSLCKGVNECTEETFNWGLIEAAIKKIKQYWELCRYQQGANIFLKLRDSLGLDSGDFSIVEKLSREVQFCVCVTRSK